MRQKDCCGCQYQVEPFLAVACRQHMKFYFPYYHHSYPEGAGDCCHKVVRHQNHGLNDVP